MKKNLPMFLICIKVNVFCSTQIVKKISNFQPDMKYKTLEPRSKSGDSAHMLERRVVGDTHSLERRFAESQSLERKIGDTHSLERRRRLPNVPRDVPSHSLPR